MQTTTRKDVLETLKEDLNKKLSVANGYNTEIQDIRIGMYVYEDFNILPAISFYCDVDEIEDYLMGRTRVRLMNIDLWLWSKSDGISNTTGIYDFIDDIENFLTSSDFTFSEDLIMGTTEIYVGGVQDQAQIGLIKFQVRYLQD